MLTDTGVAHRPEEWNRVVRPLVGDYVTDRTAGDDFHGRVKRHMLGDLRFVDVRATAHTVRRAEDPSGELELFIAAQVSGESDLHVGSTSLHLSPGDVFIADTHAEMLGEHGDNFQSIAIGVAASRVPALRTAMRPASVVALRRGTGLVDAYSTLVRQLSDRIPAIPADDATCAVWAALDLAQAMMSVEAGSLGAGNRRRSVNLPTLHRYIEAHLSDPELSVGQVAAAHFVSTRYVQTVFADGGETVAAWIRDRRVAQACRDLVNPSLRQLPVATVGTRLGFATPSHFGQVFREATGQTPNAYRFSNGDNPRS